MRLIDADELKTAFPASENSTPVLIASVRATINHMPTIELDRTTYGMNGWNKKNERGTVVNCLLDKCEYNRDCFCTREEITLSEEHYCIGGCDDGWKIKEEDDED